MKTARARAAERKNTSGAPLLRMAKASEQMEKALKVSECVPEVGTELHLTGPTTPVRILMSRS